MSETKLNLFSGQKKAYLKAMGIDVWLKRDSVSSASPPESDLGEDALHMPAKQKLELTTKPTQEIRHKNNIDELDWQALYSVVMHCDACKLAEKRSQVVFGSGDKQARLMIITEAPDAEEEAMGKPVVGDPGDLLSAMLKAIGLLRKDVYITNINKCRPPENRAPSVEETEFCYPYLLRQINLIQPELILVMGNITAQRLFNNKSTMGRLRGQLHYLENVSTPFIVTYHPAYLLKAANEKRKAWEDLKMVMSQLGLKTGLKT